MKPIGLNLGGNLKGALEAIGGIADKAIEKAVGTKAPDSSLHWGGGVSASTEVEPFRHYPWSN